MYYDKPSTEVSSMTDPAETLPDLVDEAKRILDAADADCVVLCLLGGVAVRLHAGEALAPQLDRPYKDLDFLTTGKGKRAASNLLVRLGYEGERNFNALNGHRRLLFHDRARERQIDVFVDSFSMCHSIPVAERITAADRLLPRAELLLTKLQVVKLNEKDMRDIVALLNHSAIGDDDDGAINMGRVAELTGSDWGLWRTTKLNLERLREQIDSYGLGAQDRDAVLSRADALWAQIQAAPKSAKWKMRSRVGDRKRWYVEPDEVG